MQICIIKIIKNVSLCLKMIGYGFNTDTVSSYIHNKGF